MLSVVTYFWRDETRDKRGYVFNHDHIRILRNMVQRNLTIPHKFICVTDDEVEGVETFPLDWRTHIPGTVFIRLMQHNPEIGQKIGQRILSLDLDMVVTGNLDEIAGRTEDIVLWRNPNFPQPGRAFYQSSIQLFTPGARPELWADFDPKETPRWVNWRFGGAEQAWISERLDWQESFWDARDGVYGAGRLGGKGVKSELPKNARIVSFPGAREPSQPETQAQHPWIQEHYW